MGPAANFFTPFRARVLLVKESVRAAPATSFVALARGAVSHVRRADPRMAQIIRRVGPFRLQTGRAGDTLTALLRTIVYQQLSNKAAAAIFCRFRALFDAETFPDARAILRVADRQLRSAGLSRQKVAALRDVCRKVASGQLALSGLEGCADEQIIDQLTIVRGIGRWSAQMFLIFDLGRLDVWPETDLGIRKALMRLHALEALPDPRAARALGEPFAPYRTVASWYLWRSIDGDPGDW
jgi:DNA-3-methyladenine glycosylase II